MQLVHHPAGAALTMRAALAAALLAAVALGGCGGDSDTPAAQAGAVRLGLQVRLANCESWKDAGARERYATLAALRRFGGDRTGSPGGYGATIEDDDAYELLDRSCEAPYARSFKLYKLYTRAAAFSGMRESR